MTEHSLILEQILATLDNFISRHLPAHVKLLLYSSCHIESFDTCMKNVLRYEREKKFYRKVSDFYVQFAFCRTGTKKPMSIRISVSFS